MQQLHLSKQIDQSSSSTGAQLDLRLKIKDRKDEDKYKAYKLTGVCCMLYVKLNSI